MKHALRAIAFLAVLLASPAPAEPQLQLKAALFCDTADQAQAFGERYTGDNAIEALAEVGAAFGAGACGPMTVLMRRLEEVARFTSAGHTYAVVRAEIVSVRHPAGGFFMVLPEPWLQFTLMPVAERGA